MLDKGRIIVPVTSGSQKTLGLSSLEWIVILFVLVTLYIFTDRIFIYLLFLVPTVIVYVKILSRMEENIVFVLISSFKIPNVIYGYFSQVLPIEKSRSSAVGSFKKPANDK